MTQKIALSIPDDLHEKMQQWKEYFNYSGLFQSIVSREIQRKEDFQKKLKGDESMSEVIKRLKKEKAETSKNYNEQGKDAGLKWAKSAHYEEIQIVLEFSGGWEHGQDVNFLDGHDIYGGSWEEYWKEIKKNDSGLYTDDGFDNFVSGWIEGLNEFWNEVENKI